MTTTEYLETWFSRIEKDASLANPTATALVMLLLREAKRTSRSTLPIDPKDQMPMLGVNHYNTWKKALNFLVDQGVVEVVVAGKNQSRGWIVRLIALTENIKASVKRSESEVKADVERGESEPPHAHVHEGVPAPGLVVNSYLVKDTIKARPSPAYQEAIAGEAGPGFSDQIEDRPPIRMPTLRQRVEVFDREKPNQYPEEFYDKFIDHWNEPSKKNPGRLLWEDRVDASGYLGLSGMLQSRWIKFGSDYPGWRVGIGLPETVQATGTNGGYSNGYGRQQSFSRASIPVVEATPEECEQARTRFVLKTQP